MTQEDKKLLLKDLSSRLPYGVKLLCNGWDSDGGYIGNYSKVAKECNNFNVRPELIKMENE